MATRELTMRRSARCERYVCRMRAENISRQLAYIKLGPRSYTEKQLQFIRDRVMARDELPEPALALDERPSR